MFFVLGGEGAISLGYVTGHFHSNDLAAEFGAMIVAVEHRFYGQSIPTADSSTPNLKYLSTQQALADYAYFRVQYAEQNNLTGPWVVFGGSYSGNLSGWLKMKYPWLFAGAIAASSPVLAQLDFQRYLAHVGFAIGTECYQNFVAASQQIETLLSTTQGLQTLSQNFNTCAPLVQPLDIQMFIQVGRKER